MVSRANHHLTYLARFQLIAAMNPCRCGYLSDPERACARAPRCSQDYLAKISGPLLDRFDLAIEVEPVSALDLTTAHQGEASETVAARIREARDRQAFRYAAAKGGTLRTNAEADGELLESVAAPEDCGRELLSQAVDRLKLSARAYHRVLRVARTIADLDASDRVAWVHLAEALSYRARLAR